jgi:hypothetical protein
MPEFRKSNKKYKKYSVITPKGRVINFGDRRYEQYRDSTGLGLYSNLDHKDKDRQKRYLARAKGIKDKSGKLTWKDPESSNYYSIRFLWS